MQQTIANLKNKDNVQLALTQVHDNLIKICNTESSYSNNLTQYLITRGGKRLRPLLVILSSIHRCEMEKVVDVATAAELIHTASLVHDDIVDDSPLRRGAQTINNKYNNSVAVLVGDFLFAKSFDILSRYGQGEILNEFTKAISMMSIGELEQLNNRYKSRKSLQEYYREIDGKTSVLISACCKSGAILSNMKDEDVENLAIYGSEIGYAFQIVDDLLDIQGEANELGKLTYKDLLEGNITLPVILLLETLPEGGQIEEMILRKNFTEENLLSLREELNEKGVINKTFIIAQDHVDKALRALEKTADFTGKERLKTLASFIIQRKK